MNKLTDELIITCRTTCGCGNKLIPYTKQTETTHYLLTCDAYSDTYNHPLLIAIDMNSPVFIKARKWDEIKDGTLGFIRAFNWLDQNKSIFEKERKLRERIERTKMHTKSVLHDYSPNKGELQRILNLLDYLLEDEK